MGKGFGGAGTRLATTLAALSLTGGCGGSTPASRADAGTTAPLEDNCGERADCGPAREDLFDPRRLAEVRLTFDPADLARLVVELRAQGHTERLETWQDVLWGMWRHCAPYDNLVPATLQYKTDDGRGDVVMKGVGVRIRGSMSRGRNPVAGMKLYFDAFPAQTTAGASARRTFAGGPHMNLLAVESDDSLLTQCLTYRLMRDFDVPEPRCNHLKVSVDGAYYGLLQNADEVDEDAFLRHGFGDIPQEGSLYRCSGGCGYDDSFADLEYHGDHFPERRLPGDSDSALTGDTYDPPAYELVRGQRKAHEQDLIPMMKCGDPLATPDDAAFATCIKDWIDVPEWLRLIAGETLIPVMESFVGVKTNYYLYFRPDIGSPRGGRFSVYSWDYDAALLRASCYPAGCDPLTSVAGWYGPSGQRARLVTRLTRVFRADYCAAMNAFLRDAYRPELVDELAGVLDATMRASPVPYVSRGGVNEPVPIAPLDYEQWQAKLGEVRAFMTTHRGEAQAAVDAACSTPSVAP